MNNLRIRNVPNADVNIGEFNNCEHLFLQIEPGKCQTISCRLPNGKFVTFAFVKGPDGSEEMECVDIHTTSGQHWKDNETLGKNHYQQHLVGFSKGRDTFDTRKIKEKTSLATLLLNSDYYK